MNEDKTRRINPPAFDDEFSAHPGVSEARNRVAALTAERQTRTTRVTVLKALEDKLKATREEAIAEINRLGELRPDDLLEAFLGDGDMRNDDKALRNIKARKLEIRRIDLVLPVLHKRINAAQHDVGKVDAQLANADEELRALLDSAKATPTGKRSA